MLSDYFWFRVIDDIKMRCNRKKLSKEETSDIIHAIKHIAIRTMKVRGNMLNLKQADSEQIYKIVNEVMNEI